jgi:hypothetical protein
VLVDEVARCQDLEATEDHHRVYRRAPRL